MSILIEVAILTIEFSVKDYCVALFNWNKTSKLRVFSTNRNRAKRVLHHREFSYKKRCWSHFDIGVNVLNCLATLW